MRWSRVRSPPGSPPQFPEFLPIDSLRHGTLKAGSDRFLEEATARDRLNSLSPGEGVPALIRGSQGCVTPLASRWLIAMHHNPKFVLKNSPNCILRYEGLLCRIR